MHVINCVSLVSDKENGNVTTAAGLMTGQTPPPASPPPPPPPPSPPPCLFSGGGFSPPPPPPPPLPPPGGPPAPPPPPGLPPPSHMNKYSHLGEKKRMRSFFWKTIPEEQVRGRTNIWTLVAEQQQNYQIDAKTIEELFGQQEDTTKSSLSKRRGTLNSFFKDAKEEITILDVKRSMNIGIFLKQFKKSPQSIVEDIHQGKSEHYGSETLREFLKLLPESEEVNKLKTFSGDVSKLSLEDSFMHNLIQVPNYTLRIEAMVLKKEFSPSCSSLNTDIAILRAATKELMSCEELHSILHLVLQAGNIMNAGRYAGNAVGFKLSSLLKLADTKANKPGMNLLHFVAQEAQKKDASLLNFSEKLCHVQEAARLSLDNTEAELHSLLARTRTLKENIQRDGELCQQMEDFLQFAVEKLTKLERWKQELQKEAHTLIDFFCEDKETMKLDECLRIFRDFCAKFNKAVKDNHCREVQELRRLQRLKELEQKRNSWAAGELGIFGRSSSENDVGLLTEKGAEYLPPFLQRKPTSPSYWPPNTRRSRLSLGISAERELLTFLECSTDISEEESSKFNTLPRSSLQQARPTVAWMEPAEPRDLNSKLAHRPWAWERQEESPSLPPASPVSHPPSQGPAPSPCERGSASSRARRGGVDVLRKRNSAPMNLGPAPSSPLSPLALGFKKHELVTGLAHFDLQGPKIPEEMLQQTPNDLNPVALASLEGGSLQSPRTSDGALRPEEGLGPAVQVGSEAPDGPSSAALVSVGSGDPENKDPEPPCCSSDTTDCSLTLDCSEGTDFGPGGREPEEGQAGAGIVSCGAGEAGDSQVSPNPASSPPEEAPAPVSEMSQPSCKGGLPRGKPAKDKDVIAPKKNSLREASKGSPKHEGVRQSQNISETEGMHKIVRIPKSTRGSGDWKRGSFRETSSNTDTLLSRRSSVRRAADTSLRGLSAGEDQRLPPASSGSGNDRLGKEHPVQQRGSLKPTAKPLRYAPRQKPEENKVCHANAQASESSEEETKTPPAPSAPRAPPRVPSFARSTIASSSRYTRTDPPTVAKAPVITRTASQRQPRVRGGPKDAASKDSSMLRRTASVRIPKKCSETAEGPSANLEAPLKDRRSGIRASLRLKDSSRTTLGKILNPLRK